MDQKRPLTQVELREITDKARDLLLETMQLNESIDPQHFLNAMQAIFAYMYRIQRKTHKQYSLSMRDVVIFYKRFWKNSI